MPQLHTETAHSHQAGLALLADQNYQWIRSFSKELKTVIIILENQSLPLEFKLRSMLKIIPLNEYFKVFAQFPVLFEVFIHADPNGLRMMSKLFRTVIMLFVSDQINNLGMIKGYENEIIKVKLATLYHHLNELLESANEHTIASLQRLNSNGY